MNFFGNFDPDATVIVDMRAGRLPMRVKSVVWNAIAKGGRISQNVFYQFVARGWGGMEGGSEPMKQAFCASHSVTIPSGAGQPS